MTNAQIKSLLPPGVTWLAPCRLLAIGGAAAGPVTMAIEAPRSVSREEVKRLVGVLTDQYHRTLDAVGVDHLARATDHFTAATKRQE